MLELAPDRTYVRRLRAVALERDRLALRLRLERCLSNVDWHPAGLPNSAVLCLRKLTAPPFSRRRWESAVSEALAEVAKRACRPFLGPVPADAPAVLFLDRAEMLACLAMDCASGTAHQRWWWHDLFPGADFQLAVVRQWIEHPKYIPASIELLAKTGDGRRFLRQISPSSAHGLLRAVAEAHGFNSLLPALSAAPKEAEGTEPAVAEDQWEIAGAPSPVSGAPEEAGFKPAPPVQEFWEPLLPEIRSFQALPQMVQAMLVVAILAKRAPQLLRTSSFFPSLVRYVSRASDSAATFATAAASTTPEAPPAFIDERRSETPPESRPLHPVERLPFPPEVSTPPAVVPSAVLSGSAAERMHLETSVPPADAKSRMEEPARFERRSTSPAPAEIAALASKAYFESDFAGVFYLANIALALGLYGDFAHPAEPGIDLSLWDFLALIGDEFTGGQLSQDPLWAMLAGLAGRKACDRPGAEVDPPQNWRPPDGWPPPPSDGLRSWISWLCGHIAATLQRGFRTDSAGEVARLLVARRGRIHITPAHVEVRFPLAEHPIEIRIAGWDRDPGWIPSAGRILCFYFE